ncbi:MAG: ester cyclase [Anaerolineaceae bacterium]|nr:ester cyclase [Anaerolineaceae bacterium]
MTAEENKRILRRFFTEVFEQGNLAVVDEIISTDWVNIDPSLPPLKGREGAKQLVSMFRTAFPDLKGGLEDMVAEGNRVAGRFSFTGTHKGDLMGIKPTSKHVTLTGTGIFQIENGKLLKNQVNFDSLGMLQQIGVVPQLGVAK